jgi:glycosyltransferase involved in cell wall biosynthesis
MRLLIDLSVLEIAISGIGRATIGFYEACTRLNPSLEVKGIHRRPLTCNLPDRIKNIRWARYFPKHYWRRYALSMYCNLYNPDIIHFPWNKDVVRPNRSATIVLTIHDVIPLAVSNLYFKDIKDKETYIHQMQSGIDKADLIITDSVSSKNDIMKYLKPRSEPLVIYLANTIPDYADNMVNLPYPPESYYIYLGGYERRKGLDQLVRVYVRLFNEGIIKCPLILLGYPNHFSEEVHINIEKGKAIGAVIEKGYVSDRHIAGFLHGARALIYPSRYEGFGYPPLEAMAQGCPVITTNVSSIPEVCGDAALYVKPDNDEELSHAISKIDRNTELRNTLRIRSLEQATKFSWDNSARIYLEALDKLVNDGQTQRSRN